MFTDDLKFKFKYDPETGHIIRLIKLGNYAAGTICTGRFKNGYGKVTCKGVQMLSHRLAWFLYYGVQPPNNIDHINLNKFDNRISNLREATVSQNQMNIKVHKRSLTGIKGIMPIRNGTLYRAEIAIGGRRYQKHSKDISVLEKWLEDTRPKLHKEFTAH